MSLSRIELSVWALSLTALAALSELVCALADAVAWTVLAQLRVLGARSADTHGHGSGHGPSALPFPRSPRDKKEKS